MAGDAGAALRLARRRLRAQLLSGALARDPVTAVQRLLAVQAQDPRGARLAVRARVKGGSAADVERALSEERSLLITWLNRGTLHLVRREDYPWLQALTTPPLVQGNARRLAQEGVTPDQAERAVRVISRAVGKEGPLTRLQLRERVRSAGVRVEGQALVHVLMLASLRGLIVRGPMTGRQHAFALVADWLGPQDPVERERALAELARRYLAGHGPADDRDLARWAGLPLRDARAGLQAIAGELTQVEDGLVELRGAPRPRGLPPPRLLGPFEPVLLGWRSREFIVDGRDSAIINGGMFSAFALVRGKAAARWGIRDGAVRIEPFRALEPEDLRELERDGAEVLRYLGL